VATTYKVLGQAAPASASMTALYTVPSATEAVLSTITICNRGGSSGTVRMAVRPNSASLANQHYFVYDAAVAANDSLFLTVGATMDASDVLDVYASTASFSFHAYGSELS
jgi:hypothetical protein